MPKKKAVARRAAVVRKATGKRPAKVVKQIVKHVVIVPAHERRHWCQCGSGKASRSGPGGYARCPECGLRVPEAK